MFASYERMFNHLPDQMASKWMPHLRTSINAALNPDTHGTLSDWKLVLESLPRVSPSVVQLVDHVGIGHPNDLSDPEQKHLVELLRRLHPWRKGPWDVFGIHIDTEWRSDWKWQRIAPHLHPLQNRLVLDVGCGNGYYAFRLIGAGAKLVIGVDPFLLYVMQYLAMHQFVPDIPAFILPLGDDDIPSKLHAFDTVLSMGVLYHRRSPFDHLFGLRDALRSGGQLVLETLVIDASEGNVLVPEDRYAQMRNVWFIPSCLTLESWLRKVGFHDVALVDVSKTTVQEQRRTDWMTFHSLEQFLDAENPQKTVEGHPAPVRATFIANAP